jgi:condensin complex subunit 3
MPVFRLFLLTDTPPFRSTREELYLLLRKALLDRTKDKEYTIRSNAAKCLAVLCPHETPEDARDGEPTVQETLLEMLSNDSSP